MMRNLFLLAALACVIAPPALAATPVIPSGWQAQHVKPVAHIQLEGRRIFKLGLKEKAGRYYLFAGDGSDEGPMGAVQVIDVTDPKKPRYVTKVAVPHGSGQITLNGDLLIAGQQQPFSPPEAGGSVEYPYRGAAPTQNELATLFDISDPEQPVKLSAWQTAGWATHRNSYPGGRLAFMSAWVSGFHGQSILSILDVSNPRRPHEVGRWWQPGQKDGDADPVPAPGYHGPSNLSADGKTLTLGFTPSFVNLDISDPSRPRVIGKLDFAPLAPVGTQAIHSVVPIHDGYWYVSTEPSYAGCEKENASFAAVVDNRDRANPRLAAYFPRPIPPAGSAYKSFCDKEGRFGPHNVNTEYHQAAVQRPGNLIYQTYFNAGLRIYDVRDPRQPQEVGWFLPKIGPWSERKRGPEDVIVDRRGNIFTSTGRETGIWVLHYVGPVKP